jgi:hypothetical protein
MARLSAVLGVIARSAWRNVRSVGGFAGNNLFAVIVLLMAEEPRDRPSSTAAFYLVIGLLYAIPLANDLTLRIPAERFALWPLRRMERAIVYAVNLALNPLLFIAVMFAALSRHRAVGVGLLASGIVAPFAAYALRLLARRVRRVNRFSILRIIPRFPGRLGGLVQNHVREQLRMLDVYFAAALSIGGVVYRFFDRSADAMATLVIGHLVVIMMSTLAQAHLAFDGETENTRARLLPVSGAAMLFAKDAAWLSILAVLAAGYASLPVAIAAVAALTVGHSTTARPRIEQRRGHFASGTLGPVGIVQVLAIVLAGGATFRLGMPVASLFLGAYAMSLFWYGRKWQKAHAAEIELQPGTTDAPQAANSAATRSQ